MPRTSRSRLRGFPGDLLAAFAWFAGLLAFDGFTSSRQIGKALRKAKHDPDAVAVVKASVLEELARMGLAYVVMALAAAVVLYLLRRARNGRHPWRDRAIFVGLTTLWMAARGAVLYPLLYIGGFGVRWLADHAHPAAIDGLYLALLAAWIALPGRPARQPRPGWIAALALALLGVSLADAVPPAPAPVRNKGPNVLIVGVDALRPDHLRHFGYTRDTAPRLDRFLDEATVFDNAVTPLPRTWPAWTSILTGTDPTRHGQRMSLPKPGSERPRNGIALITDALHAAGYHTRFMTDDSRFSYMVPSMNFDVIDQPPVNVGAFALSGTDPHFRAFFNFLHGPAGWRIARAWRYNQAFGNTWDPLKFAEHVAAGIADASRHDRFFMAVHFCTLHAPGSRTWPWHKLFDMPQGKGSNRFRYRSTGSKVADGDRWGDRQIQEAEKRSRQQNLNIYDAGIAMVDASWARIARALDEGGLWDDTLVVVLSDHGEDFLEDDTRYPFRGPNHGYTPWGTGQSRVVLALKGGGFRAASREDLVSLVDIAPTIARYTGVDLPTATGRPLQDPVPDRVLFGETGVSEDWYRSPDHVREPMQRISERYAVDPATKRLYQRPSMEAAIIAAKDFWALDPTWWLVRESLVSGPRYSLFRWHEDPTFGRDLAAEHPEVVERLATALSRHLGEAPPAAEAAPSPDDDPGDRAL